MSVLTKRFAQAVDYARIAHADQTRKGTEIPYLTHLLSVASLRQAAQRNGGRARY